MNWADLVRLVWHNLKLIAAVLVFSFLAFDSDDNPFGWGAAYSFGTPVTAIEIPGSCDTEIVISSRGSGGGTTTCGSTSFRIDGQQHHATLYASNDDVEKNPQGDNEYTGGEARAFGDSLYGRPWTGRVIADFTLVSMILFGALVIAGSVLVALCWLVTGNWSSRRPDSRYEDSKIPGRLLGAEWVSFGLVVIGSWIYALLM